MLSEFNSRKNQAGIITGCSPLPHRSSSEEQPLPGESGLPATLIQISGKPKAPESPHYALGLSIPQGNEKFKVESLPDRLLPMISSLHAS
jgi:hypothetical protein